MLFCSAVVIGGILWVCDQAVNKIYEPIPEMTGEEDAKAKDGGDAAKMEEGRAGNGAACAGCTCGGCQCAKGTGKGGKDDGDKGGDKGDKKDDEDGKGGDKKGDDKKDKGPPRRVLGVPLPEAKQLQNLDNNMRQAILHLTRVQKPPFGVSLPAQIILFAWGLCIMLTMALYTGATAAQLTSIALSGGIKDRNDLKGKSVVTWKEYVPVLAEMGIPAYGAKQRKSSSTFLVSGVGLQLIAYWPTFLSCIAGTAHLPPPHTHNLGCRRPAFLQLNGRGDDAGLGPLRARRRACYARELHHARRVPPVRPGGRRHAVPRDRHGHRDAAARAARPHARGRRRDCRARVGRDAGADEGGPRHRGGRHVQDADGQEGQGNQLRPGGRLVVRRAAQGALKEIILR